MHSIRMQSNRKLSMSFTVIPVSPRNLVGLIIILLHWLWLEFYHSKQDVDAIKCISETFVTPIIVYSIFSHPHET